ncbi:hypothetical protein SAMN04487964_1032 [Marinobacterium sediminicola]|uniref:Uncharacterized protein n=1 Tax=Marinobacterium sediminicola TaxID=518898 RepID=A0ABY1RXR7_9GAMM|nr:hypothetical protein SAMN04487964_1032 [Marinobacterium sediminicola]
MQPDPTPKFLTNSNCTVRDDKPLISGAHAMKKSRHTKEQITFALKQSV